MKLLSTILLLLLFSFCVAAQNQYDADKCKDFIQQNKIVKCWDWIVPLKTTKAEIEKAFSKSVSEGKKKSRKTYKTSFGELNVNYTTGNDKYTEECNCELKSGAVISASIFPDQPVKVSFLDLDLTKFDKSGFEQKYTYYEDYNSGIWIFTIKNQDGDEIVEEIVLSSPIYKKKWTVEYQKKLSEYLKRIKPLKTNRQQIEKLFGQPTKTNCTSCVYKTPRAEIQVNYSTIPCKSTLEGWNVLPDTVLKVKIDPYRTMKFSHLDINENDYFEYIRSHFHSYDILRLHKLTGAIYELSNRGDISSVFLFPSKADSNFRCYCYPPYNPLGQLYQLREYEAYLMSDEDNIQAEIDGAFLQATNQGKPFRFHFVVYLGKDDSPNRYKVYMEKVWKAWNYRGYPPKDLKIINGGRREKFEVDFFILPRLC